MKVVVIGGTGLIGSKLVGLLRHAGHEAVAASPSSGVNTMTGAGLAEALAGAQVVVDVTNSPSFEDTAVLQFFETSTRNLLGAEHLAGVRHHVALSIVGTDKLPASGYLRAKVAQEARIKAGPVPYTIVRATQFFEFLGAIADAATIDGVAHVSTGGMQPVAADDVAATLADVAVAAPRNAIVELGGPAAAPMAEIVAAFLRAKGDARKVVADARARYFGTEVDDEALTPGPGARLGKITFAEWLSDHGMQPQVLLEQQTPLQH